MQANVQGQKGARQSRRALVEQIAGQLARRRSTADVLFHHAVAVRLGLGPTDHKCMDLLRERGAISATELASITGLTSGAITGVVARLEHAGFLRREPDARDGRKQILYPVPERVREIHAQVFAPLRNDVTAVLETFDTRQLAAIAEFLVRTTDVLYRHLALLRAQTLSLAGDSPHASGSGDSRPLPRKKQKRTGRRERV